MNGRILLFSVFIKDMIFEIKDRIFEIIVRNDWNFYMMLGISCLCILMYLHFKYHQSVWLIRKFPVFVRLMRRKTKLNANP